MTTNRKSILSDPILPTVKNSNNNIHVAFIYGGLSNEREVTLFSKPGIIKALIELGYKVTPVDMGNDLPIILHKLKPDIVYNGLYGTHGEDGCLPGLLEIMNLKYTHSGVLTSALGMNKIFCSDILRAQNIKCPPRKIIHKKNNITEEPFERPFVIKPSAEGSSIGVELIFKEDNFNFADYPWKYGDIMITEKYIPGIEIEVAVVGNQAIGAVEIEPLKNRFYDYETKYKDGMAKHHIPPRLNNKAYKKCLELAEKIHRILEIKSVSRVDFRYNPNEGENGEFYFLEINTHPGMTPLSLVPEICTYYGITFNQIIDRIIKDGLQ